MLTRLSALMALALLSGCQTPAQLKTSPTMQHESVSFPFAVPTEKAAACLQRVYENASAYITTRLTPLGAQSYELVARSDQTYTFAIFEISPGRIETWAEPSFVPPGEVATILGGCR